MKQVLSLLGIEQFKVLLVAGSTLAICIPLVSGDWRISIWFALFAVIAYEDSKHSSFSAIGGILLLLYSAALNWQILYGLKGLIIAVVMLLMLVVSRVTKEHIGTGDVLVLSCIAALTSVANVMHIVFLASAAALVVGLWSRARKKKADKLPLSAIAFVPFLFMGSFVVLVLFQ